MVGDSMQFVTLTEVNEWEGETWRFRLQFDGNEETLQKFATILSSEELGEEPEYALDMALLSEDAVDLLVRSAEDGDGYMSDEHKVTGTFVIPEDNFGEHFQSLYKGGIKDFFTEPTNEAR